MKLGPWEIGLIAIFALLTLAVGWLAFRSTVSSSVWEREDRARCLAQCKPYRPEVEGARCWCDLVHVEPAQRFGVRPPRDDPIVQGLR
jgi:hypothetical protein